MRLSLIIAVLGFVAGTVFSHSFRLKELRQQLDRIEAKLAALEGKP